MARSTYVWVAQDSAGVVLAACTVKRELVAWLRRPGVLEDVATVVRIRDGVCEPAILLDVKTLVEGA